MLFAYLETLLDMFYTIFGVVFFFFSLTWNDSNLYQGKKTMQKCNGKFRSLAFVIMLATCLRIYMFSFRRPNYIFSCFKFRSSQKCKTKQTTKKSKPHLLFLAAWTSTVKSVIKFYSILCSIHNFFDFQISLLFKTDVWENQKTTNCRYIHHAGLSFQMSFSLMLLGKIVWEMTEKGHRTVTSLLKWNRLWFAVLLHNLQNLMAVNEWHTNGIYKFSPFCCF